MVKALARSLNIPFVQLPINRTELLIADEIGLCGTLAELTLVRTIDVQPLTGEWPIHISVQRRCFEAIRGTSPQTSVEITMLHLTNSSHPWSQLASGVVASQFPVTNRQPSVTQGSKGAPRIDCRDAVVDVLREMEGFVSQSSFLVTMGRRLSQHALDPCLLQHCRTNVLGESKICWPHKSEKSIALDQKAVPSFRQNLARIRRRLIRRSEREDILY